MSKTPRSESIAQSVYNPLTDNLPGTAQEFTDALVKAARLGKISGLRRARKAFREALQTGDYPFDVIEKSIRSTYVAMGADTAAYEADQRERHPERYGLTDADEDTVVV